MVADEVRKLAERTSKATKEIAGMVRTIQSETKSAVEAMHTGSQDVEVGVAKTTASGAALSQIIQVAEEVGSLVACIATAASQQASATEDITRNITQISNLAQDSANAAEQAAASCTDLSSLGTDLGNSVSQFKLAETQAVDRVSMHHRGHQQSFAVAASASTKLLAPARRARSVPLRP